jgi:FkbM family methyltransferase
VLGYIHHKVRTTPWLGRIALKSIPNIKWHLRVEPLGRFTIRLREHRMFWLRPALNHEGFMLGTLNRLVRPGDVVYDVGANIGLYSRFIVQCFHASHVFAFEPFESNRRLLDENVEGGECKGRVTVLACAVGELDGVTDFQIDDLTSNTGRLDTIAHGSASESRAQYGLPPALTQVEIHRIDTLIANGSIPVPNVMKIDVEGAEAMALRGASGLLSMHKPRLVVEFHGAEVTRHVLEILWSYDYHCFGRIAADGVWVYKEIVAADLETIAQRYSLSYIAASVNREEVQEPIEDFNLGGRHKGSSDQRATSWGS